MKEDAKEESIKKNNFSEKSKWVVFLGPILIILILAGIFIYVLNKDVSETSNQTSKQTPTGYSPQKVEANFTCKEDKSIIAIFNNDTDGSVDLALSDGRTLNLARTVSGSGSRYANEDESIVFWNKGNTAFLEEGGVQTYSDCVDIPAS